jgi:hypothetical protein
MEKWRNSSTILDLGTRWRCSQLRGTAVLSPVPIGLEAGWAPEPVCMEIVRSSEYSHVLPFHLIFFFNWLYNPWWVLASLTAVLQASLSYLTSSKYREYKII